MTEKLKGHIALLLTNFLFGINYSWVKYVESTGYIKPFGLNMSRVFTALLLFWTMGLASGKTLQRVSLRDVPRFVICGLTGVTINQLFFIEGMTMTTSIHASLLALVTPLLITLFSFWMLKDRLSFKKMLGLLLGIVGACLLVAHGSHSGENSQSVLTGDIFILANGISYSFFMVLVRPLMDRYDSMTILRYMFLFGGLLMLPFGLNDFLLGHWFSLGIKGWFCLAGICLGATFFAYLFNVYGIAKVGASTAGSYIYTQPVFATLISILFMHESFRAYMLTAAMLIFAGVFLVSDRKKKFT